MCKISIVVPVYNVEDYLDECVRSLIDQTLGNIEIILVDDGSTDSSGAMCDRYAEQDTRVVALHKANGGQSSARNMGVEKACGEYILFVDSDDYIRLDTCQTFFEWAEKSGADIVTGDILNEAEKLERESEFRRFARENIAIKDAEYLSEALNVNAYDIVPWIRLVRKEYLVKNGISFKEGCYYEDQLYTLQLFTSGASVCKIRYPFYYYRMDRAGSTTNAAGLKKGTDFISVLTDMIMYVKGFSEKSGVDERDIDSVAKILGLAYYHLSAVWLNMKAEDQKIIIRLIKENKLLCKGAELVRFNDDHIKKQVEAFIKKPRLLKFKRDLKLCVKKILR